MPKPLQTLTVSAPGFFGLNTQQAGDILPPGWATVMSNIVYDDVGRIASRKGHRQVNGTAITASPTVQALHEYIDASGNVLNIVATDDFKIYKEVSGTMTEITGTITTPTAGYWQFANFNGLCVGYQAGHEPIVLTDTSSSFQDMSGYLAATAINGTAVLSGWGRTWTVLNNTLYYSDLLIHSYAGGSSGNLDLSQYWPGGMDVATGIAEFNGYLIVFGKESILIYENPDDVDNISLLETLSGIGCTARDSIKQVGTDLVFLSSSGLRSLSRAIQEKSMPERDISKHTRDELLKKVDRETPDAIKSMYVPSEGFYLLSLPATGQSYYFDLKFPNEDGTWKTTNWTLAPTAMMYSRDKQFYMALEDGYISTYLNYRDGANSSGVGGSSYNMDYEGVWNDMGEEVGNFMKIPKSFSVLGTGAVATSVSFKWALDYSLTFDTRNITFGNAVPTQYGIGQYDVDSYSISGDFTRKRGAMASTGQVIKIGLAATIQDSGFAVQRIDVLAKIGRLAL